ncbi:MAG: hypothetical protein JWQ35_2194, partial [Bacteriovoracaceae bacterium]|nr:hypothetical protein [Bacteriovoracaceae bacterium]
HARARASGHQRNAVHKESGVFLIQNEVHSIEHRYCSVFLSGQPLLLFYPDGTKTTQSPKFSLNGGPLTPRIYTTILSWL